MGSYGERQRRQQRFQHGSGATDDLQRLTGARTVSIPDLDVIGARSADWAFCVTRIRLQGALLHLATKCRDVGDDRPWGFVASGVESCPSPLSIAEYKSSAYLAIGDSLFVPCFTSPI